MSHLAFAARVFYSKEYLRSGIALSSIGLFAALSIEGILMLVHFLEFYVCLLSCKVIGLIVS